jgi:hypothetical protein
MIAWALVWMGILATPVSRVEPIEGGGFEVGRPCRWIVQVEHDSLRGTASLQALPDFEPDWTVLDRNARRTVEAGRAVDRFELTVVPFRAGVVKLPDLVLRIDGSERVVDGPGVSVAAGVELPADADPEALEALAAPDPEPVPLPGGPSPWWPVAAVSTVAAAAVGLGLFWVIRRRRQVEDVPPPAERAARELATLRRDLGAMPPGAAAAELHRVARRFLETELGASPAHTVAEIRGDFAQRSVRLDERLWSLLERGEAARFGAARPSRDVVERDLDQVQRWVFVTRDPSGTSDERPAPAAFVEPDRDGAEEDPKDREAGP